MIEALLGRKVGMTAVYDEKGDLIPVTVVELGPCTVVQVKTVEKDGYNSLQLGFADRKEKTTKKPMVGHFKKAGSTPKYFVHEVGWDGQGEVKAGAVLKADLFAKGEKVDVVGTTKGRGFQGVVRRHGFGGGPITHGQSDRQRAPGSIGQSAFPSRVLKGTRMGGRMGGKRNTSLHLRVVQVDVEKNAILLEGPVPGPNSGYVMVRKQGAKKK